MIQKISESGEEGDNTVGKFRVVQDSERILLLRDSPNTHLFLSLMWGQTSVIWGNSSTSLMEVSDLEKCEEVNLGNLC